jgi:hypothetical protein
VHPIFSSKGKLRAKGIYSLEGALRAGYYNGHFEVGGPGFAVKESLLDSISGISIGANGFILADQIRIIVGIGAFGFATGPYVGLTTSIGTTFGSTIGLVQCRGATLDMKLVGGVGYSIPQPVTDAINFVLRALNVKEISGEGGIHLKPTTMLHREDLTPKVKLCTDQIGTGNPGG